MRAPLPNYMPPLSVLLLMLVAGSLGAETVLAESEADSLTGASETLDGHCEAYSGYEGRSPEAMMSEFAGELGLTSQQQTDIQIIVSDYGVRFRDLARLGRQTAGELLNMAPDDPGYRAKTDEAAALAASNAAEVVVLLAEMRGKLHAVLTPDQRLLLQQKLDEKKQQLEEKKRQYQQEDDASHDRPLEQFIG